MNLTQETKDRIWDEDTRSLSLIIDRYLTAEAERAAIVEAEKEEMMQTFDKVRKLFELRRWIMDGRGSYRYDDDRYKEEVRYLYDEFDELQKKTWAKIKTKTFEYRNKIIAEVESEKDKEIERGKEVVRLLLNRNHQLYCYAALPWEDYSYQPSVIKAKLLLNSEPNDKRSVATGDDSSNAADTKKK